LCATWINVLCQGEDVINACAKQHIDKVAEKCRKEAFSSLIRGGLEGVPSMSNLQATAFTYRNLVSDLDRTCFNTLYTCVSNFGTERRYVCVRSIMTP
jgi:hypothetical protein